MTRAVRRTLLSLTMAASACRHAPPATADGGHYVFAYFKNNGEDGLHLATSEDGLTWRALRGDSAIFTPTIGTEKLTRDPSIARGPDGVDHMVWTSGWRERGFGCAESRDLVHWTAERDVPVMAHEPAAQNAWVPDLFRDAPNSRWLICWATTIPGRFSPAPADSVKGAARYDHRIYYVIRHGTALEVPAADCRRLVASGGRP